MLSGIIEFNLGLDEQARREARSDTGRNAVLYTKRDISLCTPTI